MTRAKAIEAIDDAFADGVKRLFGLLVQRLEDANESRESAVGAFHTGVAFHDEAHTVAITAVETIFSE